MSNDNKVSQIRTTQREPERERQIFTFKASQLIWLLFGTIDALIALRVLLMLIGANLNSPIAVVIYNATTLFLIPFVGLISSLTIGNIVLEISSVFAIGVYTLIAVALERLVWLVFYRPRNPMASITETTTSEQHTTL